MTEAHDIFFKIYVKLEYLAESILFLLKDQAVLFFGNLSSFFVSLHDTHHNQNVNEDDDDVGMAWYSVL